ncbi:NAD(P)H-dependent oxidoreductase [Corallococcus macrosporus]|uniref:NAD(P)H-dependent oxidoreductase n=1 Tax=Corallococcus macrosporus TaxID=35 RepID=A0ABS3DLS3_9BACT|nr:NAD(P)H-dependent oxidoreductase [Corallococcus macrosporus]MBN8232285.1 NAD(P)H-dependent oxidoreductase [Corallococcus macrosporus]
MIKVAIVVGSTRPGRKADKVAAWVHDIAKKRGDATYDIVDIQDFNLPLLDEPTPPSMRKYTQEHTKRWSATVESYDAYVFVTPEYNHGTSGALKNALDFVYAEWNNKAAGFVGYGSAGGVRAVEQLRLVAAELQMATVRAQVQLFLSTDFEHYTVFKPDPAKEKQVNTLLDQLVSWGTALRTVRVKP